jgi:hypothetical protein
MDFINLGMDAAISVLIGVLIFFSIRQRWPARIIRWIRSR